MKLKFVSALCLIVSSLTLTTFSVANATTLEKSEKICSLLNDTITLTTPCMVDAAKRTISLEITLKNRRAGMLCGSIKRIAYANGWALPFDWKIQIKSTDTPKEPSAQCAYKSTDLFG